jgi:glyoxylase-like metal-dependent hydrolase (beta-lactamase superfamily II)
MKFSIVPVTPFDQNCSLIWCDSSKKAAVIDPGGDIDRLLQAADELQIELEKILLTHAHIDHAGGVADLVDRKGLEILGPHREDQFLIERLPYQAEQYGFPPARPFTPGRWLEQGEKIQLGNEELEVLHCPGHTPGHLVFFHRGSKTAFVGDVLFKRSIGRTDFPRGDYNTLIRSIRERLWPLGDDVTFIPGHGPLSTFGDERRTNPFVGDDS